MSDLQPGQQRSLEYARCGFRPKKHRWLWLVGGIVATIPLFVISVYFAAAGHGPTTLLVMFFGPAVFITRALGLHQPDLMPYTWMIVLTQIPLYGVLMYWAAGVGRSKQVGRMLFIGHIVGVLLARAVMS